MNTELYIAKRFLFAKRRMNFITIISYLSTAGITLGVAALIVVLAVFNGFGSLVTSFLLNFDPHVRVEAVSAEGDRGLQDVEKLFSAEKEITGYSPFASGKVVVTRGNFMQVITLKGIDIAKGDAVYGIKQSMRLGKYLSAATDGLPTAVIGINLADRLEALTGDTLTVISPANIEQTLAGISPPLVQTFIIAGIYVSNNNDYDAQYVFTSLDEAAPLLGYEGGFQGYDARLKDYHNAAGVKERLTAAITQQGLEVSTWYDFHRELYSVMLIERWAAYIILSLIILVATFNILASLTMSVVEKKREIGILRAMGLPEQSINKVFLYQGIIVGFAGTMAGFLLGLFVYWLQITYKIYPLNPGQYKIDAMPMELRWADFAAVGLVAFLLSAVAAIYPARKAAVADPLEAIRWE